MLRARLMEEKLTGLYRDGGRIVGGVYVRSWQEAFRARARDASHQGTGYLWPLIRDQGGRFCLRRENVTAPAPTLGSVMGPMRGA